MARAARPTRCSDEVTVSRAMVFQSAIRSARAAEQNSASAMTYFAMGGDCGRALRRAVLARWLSTDGEWRRADAWRAYTHGVDARVLKRRQIRLYIETSALQYLAAVASAVALCGGVLYQFSPVLLPQILLWSAAIGFTLLVRAIAWMWYLRARPADEAMEPWLKWFAAPQVCAVCLIAAGPLLMLPDPGGHDVEVSFTLSILAYSAALASSIKLSVYRPIILIALVPMVAVYIAGMLQLPGAVPKLLGLGGVLAGLWG